MRTVQTLDKILQQRIVVCVGTGGVGKTTLAAALALEASRRGQRAVVVTIDPARRLAGALGLQGLSAEPQSLPESTRAELGIGTTGALSAMMLDTQATFDGLVKKFTAEATTRKRILENPIYQHVSTTLAGSSEYAAMEIVFELLESSEFDLIVLDTPPAQNAVDFLDAPNRLLEFIESRLVRSLIQPALAAGRKGFRWLESPTRRMLDLLEGLVGIGFLRDLSEFLLAFESMADGFADRARRVRETLLGPDCAFLLITGASRQTAQNAVSFLDHLETQRIPLAGLLVNRMRLWPQGAPPGADHPPDPQDVKILSEALQAIHPTPKATDLANSAWAVASQYNAWVNQDEENVEPLRHRAKDRGLFFRCLSERDSDVHDAAGLRNLSDELFDSNLQDRRPS
ncbi:MAG: ArsA-related P-loop ATPase [Myxococcota bacterium]|nr:ArsA-related P-loop ATPase [Myxococcota bacterium]